MKQILKQSNSAVVTLQYRSQCIKQIQELQNCDKYQSCRILIKESLTMQITMDCRTTPVVNFRTKLGFRQYDPIMT